MKLRSQSGFVLPVMLSCFLVVAIIAAGMLSYVSYGTRVAGIYMTASKCRLTAQTALDTTGSSILNSFSVYYDAQKKYFMSKTALDWFNTYTASSIGTSGYLCSLPATSAINGCDAAVTIANVVQSTTSQGDTCANVTLVATVSTSSPHGVPVTRKVEEVICFSMPRGSVFDHAYFVNNYGWFQGSGVTANGNIRSNGDMYLDSLSYVNGDAYAAFNLALGATGIITVDGWGTTRNMGISTYWSSSGTWARPTNPTSSDTSDTWAMGYDGTSSLKQYQDILDMPYLGDLSTTIEATGTLRQNGTVLVDGTYSGNGPSGVSGGADAGCLVLDGTSRPIVIDGSVIVPGDVVIKGTISGQGVIYAGRNIHIVGNVTYRNAPSWPKPDANPATTVRQNASADLVGLCAKGNIVLGNYTDSSWLSSVRNYITPPFVTAYACDDSDASIGYSSTFAGNYTANDGGQKITYTSKTVRGVTTYTASGSTSRRYYESAVGDQIIKNNIQSGSISEIDAVLYNNHAVMGTVGQCLFNGSMVCRNEAIIYSSSVRFNWDSRLGSSSRDGKNFLITLPRSIGIPSLVSWRELALCD